LKKRLETLEKTIPALKAESGASHEFRAKNEALNLELRQMRTSLNNSQLEVKEVGDFGVDLILSGLWEICGAKIHFQFSLAKF
jgi:hypothetical protein